MSDAFTCSRCEADLRYVGNGEWHCDCGLRDFADWLDGPRVAAWLEDTLPRSLGALEGEHPIFIRTIRRWQNPGAKVNAYSLDAWLLTVGMHLSEVPDDLWLGPHVTQHTRLVAA